MILVGHLCARVLSIHKYTAQWATVVCTSVKYHERFTVRICVPMRPHLHVLSCTSGVLRHEAIKSPSDMSLSDHRRGFVCAVWHTSSIREPYCLMPRPGPLIRLMLWTTSPSLSCLSLLSYMSMWTENVSLCAESLAQTGAHVHTIRLPCM